MSSKIPIWRWHLFVGWLAVVGCLGLAACALPMFETLGYEFALIVSLVSSLGIGHLAACYPGRVRSQLARFPGARSPGLILYGRVLAMGFLLLALPAVFSLLNGLNVPPCNQEEGGLFYLAMPVCSAILAAAVGLLIGLVMPGWKSASVVWFIVYIASLIGALSRFYSTPAVFVFGPFFGYFPGVLYDELVSFDSRLITYRAASLLQAGALIAFLSWLLDPESLRLSPKRLGQRPKTGLLAAALALGALLFYLGGPYLGHRTERAHLEALFPHKVSLGRLDLFFPPGTDARLVEALSDDAMFSLHQVAAYFDTSVDKQIGVFFFANAAEKGKAMGASGTNVAKPWRSEVYVTLDEPPHRVLRHELAHIVAARFGQGPFAIAGAFGGFWPNPGLIEGMAVAAEGQRRDLTVHQWAAAMKRLKLLPSMTSIFGLGFFNLTASAAYTAAGSFCAWVHDNFGAKALNKVYGGSGWKSATGKDLDHLEKKWILFLEQVPLEDADIAVAKHRFDRPAIIHSVCVHEVAKLRAEASRFAGMGLFDENLKILGQAHERSGRSTGTRLGLFYAHVDAGQKAKVRHQANGLLVDKAVSSVARAGILEILTDYDLAEGKLARAKRSLDDLILQAPKDADRRRLEVKAHLTGLPKSVNSRLFHILAIRPGPSAVTTPLAMLAIAQAAHEMPDDPILTYLLARQYFNYRDYESALKWLEKAEQQGLQQTTKAIWLATGMIRGRALHHLGRKKEAVAAFKQIANDKTQRQGARARARDWEERAAYYKKQ